MKNKKNDGKYVIIDDGTAGGLFLSENEYYVDENKKVVLCNSEKKDNLFRKRYKLTHGDKCYSIIKYFCPEVEFISIKIMETGERGSIDSFKAALEWCLKEKIKLVHMSVGTTNYIDAKKIENIIKQMVATVYKGNIIKNLIMDCQSYTKYRPNETTGGIFVSWRRKEELPTGA